jgi:hypothetical protein
MRLRKRARSSRRTLAMRVCRSALSKRFHISPHETLSLENSSFTHVNVNPSVLLY